ncbi:MAG: mycothiol synthase [Acidimicrobiia bacterium]|nr:mycothiol synthase [Acidimicrobiia bacterium]NNL14550.1 mycothiol synthase [Acidimicrobiia bacterium]
MNIRRLRPGTDIDEVSVFLAQLEAETGIPPLGESKFVDLVGPHRGVGFIAEERGSICAYLHLLQRESSQVWELEVAAEQLPKGDLERLLAAAATEASSPMLWWTFGESESAAFAGARFPVARTLHKFVGSIPLPDPWHVPEGVRVAHFRPGIDEEHWLVANNAAFEGHLENGAWTVADVLERESRDWFDAAGFRLWWADDRVAGFCWTKRHGPELGEIYVIGVHPEFQGRGLGRSIVIEALSYLAGEGCRTGMLYVDTANATALDLYQSLGFVLERVDRCFAIPNGWPHEVQ